MRLLETSVVGYFLNLKTSHRGAQIMPLPSSYINNNSSLPSRKLTQTDLPTDPLLPPQHTGMHRHTLREILVFI